MIESIGSSIKDALFCDLHRELTITRKVLARMPDEHFDWRPHAKSMTLGGLAHHVADLPSWLLAIVADEQLDFASMPPQHPPCRSSAELLAMFDHNVAAVNQAAAKLTDAALHDTWTLRNGDTVLHQGPRGYLARMWAINHMISHRAQLCVYLRLLDLPVPTIYFNSADEPGWSFE